MKNHREIKLWLIALLLLAPVFLLYFAHEFIPAKLGAYSTGFIQYDQLYYMALAREHFDDGFHLFYGSPFSISADTPRIYFQPHIFSLGILQQILPFSQGTIYLIFGFVSALICMRVMIALYERVVGLHEKAHWLGLLLFAWGGGVIALWGLFQNLSTGQEWSEAISTIFKHEPAEGWWFLNLGRNLVYPTEAYYHSLFLGSILCILNKKFRWAAILMALLAMSQPFSGLQLVLIISSWCFLEKILLRSRVVRFRFLIFSCGLLFAVLGYYLFFLPRFEEHRAVYEQWKLPWLLEANAFIPAYLLVGIMSAWALRRWSLAKQIGASPSHRLFFVWFLISFALAKHELFIAPRQPIHFTRGYIWTPLFLLGSGALMVFLKYLWGQKEKWIKISALTLVSLLFLFDNIAWFGVNSAKAIFPDEKGSYSLIGIVLDAMDKDLLEWLDSRPEQKELILSENPSIGYYVTAYTKHRSWLSHGANTPFVEKRIRELTEFFLTHKISPEMKDKDMILILFARRRNPIEEFLSSFSSYQEIYRNSKYIVVKIKPITL